MNGISMRKYKPYLYGSVALFPFALAIVFAMQFTAQLRSAVSVNDLSLIKLYGRLLISSMVFAFFFLNVFAIAMTKPKIWIPLPFLFIFAYILASIVWNSSLFVEGNIGGIPMFTFTSMYKAPYGLPLIETMLALMVILAVYPFFHITMNIKGWIFKIWLGIGTLITTIGYAIEITGAIPYQYMPIAIPMIFIGTTIVLLGCLYHLVKK